MKTEIGKEDKIRGMINDGHYHFNIVEIFEMRVTFNDKNKNKDGIIIKWSNINP